MMISVGRLQPINTPTAIRSLLQQFPYPFYIGIFFHSRFCTYLFIRPNSRSSSADMTDRSFFPLSVCLVEWSLPFVSSMHHVRLTTYLRRLRLSYFLLRLISPRLSFFPLMESSTLQSGAGTYIIRWIPSPGSRAQGGTESNQTEHAWCSDRRIQQERFLFSAILVYVRDRKSVV